MANQRQLTALRDVLAHGLRELAIRVAQVDVSDDTPPTEDEVRAFVASVADAAQKAAAAGFAPPEDVAVFADARMIVAALDPVRAGCRVQYAEGKTVLLAPPPPGYQLASIAHEIDKAAQEATPTEPPPKTFAEDNSAALRRSVLALAEADSADPTVEGPRAP